MKFGHLHLNFKDLQEAIAWMGKVLEKKPSYSNPNMAVFDVGGASIVFDASEVDSTATVALNSGNCDQDFKRLVSNGGEPIEAPTDLPWGVRAAYIKGPGEITVEIEQALE